jgi:predicted Zn-dependent protease
MAQIEQELAISSLPSTTLQIMYAELLYKYKKIRLAIADLINLFLSQKKNTKLQRGLDQTEQ